MEQLIELAKKGDEKAFTELIISVEVSLYKIARTRLRNEEDIKEVIQDTIIQAFKSLKKLKKPEYFKTWIIKILINNCNKIYNKNKKVNEIEYNDYIANDLSYNHIETIDSSMDFDFMIRDLNNDERLTLILFYSEKLTIKEIAKILKVSESAIKNRLSRARNKIKKEIEGGIYNG